MAKIDRYNGNLEAPASAALGTERTIFGTASQSDDLTDQFNAFLLRGWGIVGPSDQPTLQDFNAMGFTLGQIHAYLHQMGVAEYNATQEYHLGSIANAAGVLYVSLVDDNVGNAPASSPAQWSPQSDHGMVVFDSAGITAWTVPLAMQLGIIKPKVTVIGGGGGGGRNDTSAGGGGGAGGRAEEVLSLFGVTSVTVTVGAGGAGATATGIGATGSVSSFGAFMQANGGAGGGTVSGGAGGTASGGAINRQGVGGGQSTVPADGFGFVRGFGGDGASAIGLLVSTPGATNANPGCGGSGSILAANGGAGAAGIVVVEW